MICFFFTEKKTPLFFENLCRGKVGKNTADKVDYNTD